MPLSQEIHDTADRIVRRYPVARSALLPLLHLVQSEQNHITDEGVAFCAEKVGLTLAEVGSVATFYTMYKREPVGDWLLSVCTNPVCKQAGGGQIYENYKAALGGHRDPETKVTIEHAECLGICDGAPVVQVNYEMFGPMTVEEGDQLLASCRAGAPPASPWSGEKPPTFAEVHRDLSGANDAWEDQLHQAALQQIAFDRPPTYRTGETDLPVTFPGGDPAGVGGAAFREAAAGTVVESPPPQTTTGTPDVEPPATVVEPPAAVEDRIAEADDSGKPSGTLDHPPPAADAEHAGEGDPADAEPDDTPPADAGPEDTPPDDAGPEDTQPDDADASDNAAAASDNADAADTDAADADADADAADVPDDPADTDAADRDAPDADAADDAADTDAPDAEPVPDASAPDQDAVDTEPVPDADTPDADTVDADTIDTGAPAVEPVPDSTDGQQDTDETQEER